MVSRLFGVALFVSLTSMSAASAAAPSCARLRAVPAPANPKDVFRHSAFVCGAPLCAPRQVKSPLAGPR